MRVAIYGTLVPLWNQVKFIDGDPHRYTRRFKEAIQIRLHPNNIKRDSGIEIPEAWIPTIRKLAELQSKRRDQHLKAILSRDKRINYHSFLTPR